MKTIKAPWIKLAEYLNQEDYDLIGGLQKRCMEADKITLKLELDYKLAVASDSSKSAGVREINEFLYFDGDLLIGYIGICGFGGAGNPLEITGMVDPDYRKQGVFSQLHHLILAECSKRKAERVLLLCDKASPSGQSFIRKTGAIYKNSEYEMFLREDQPEPKEELFCGITLQKATNSDAYEVARQNSIYFGDLLPVTENSQTGDNNRISGEESLASEDILLPEEEEKRGMTIYLAKKDGVTIGKAHLETGSEVSGIYGLGVLPEYRGKGYGRALLLRSVEQMKKCGSRNIMLQVATKNEKALNLYLSCGFVGTSTMDYFDLIP